MEVNKLSISMSIALALGGVTGPVIAMEDDDSVERWGRWAVLSPAAGPEDYLAFAPAGDGDLDRCEASANCPSVLVTGNPPGEEPPGEQPPGENPEPAAGPCQPGAPCGFTRYTVTQAQGVGGGVNTSPSVQVAAVGGSISGNNGAGTTGNGADVGYFELNVDRQAGTGSYRTNPGEGAAEIASGEIPLAVNTPATVFGSNPLDNLNARYVSQNDLLALGSWIINGGGTDTTIRRGVFVWGVAATEAQMSALMDQLVVERGDMIARYEGRVAGGAAGSMSMDVNFGTATWSGDFNGDVPFSTGGSVNGSSFMSDAAQFSDNIAVGVVEGGFVNQGNHVIGGYDVTDLTNRRDANVFDGARSISD